jgi:hypothetical protein
MTTITIARRLPQVIVIHLVGNSCVKHRRYKVAPAGTKLHLRTPVEGYNSLAYIFVSDEIEQPSTPPPIICVNDRVLLQYAVLNDSVGFNAGHGLMFVGEKEIGRVPCLAICQDKDSTQFMLYYCDSDWSPMGIASYDTIAAAKKRAERIYPGSSGCWNEARFTEEHVNHYLEALRLACSFCGKRPDETPSTTFEGDGNTRICGDCIRKFHSGLNERSPTKD